MRSRTATTVAIIASVITLGSLAFSISLITRAGNHHRADEMRESPWAARVGEEVLLQEELALLGGDEETVRLWIEDELLAQLAVEDGLENPRTSRLVQRRARQVYLRDALLENAFSHVTEPGDQEVFDFMRTDSALYMIERHYYHILLADSSMADSIHTRLSWGEHFQTMAERVSMGQKAGIGGDLGFLVGGELEAFPREVGTLDGLSEIYPSDLGYHIFLVTETRELTDTARVVASLAEIVYRDRLAERVDSLLELARCSRDVEVIDRWSGALE